MTTPTAASPTANILDAYAHIEPAAVGSIRLDYTYAGPFERWLYDVRDPVGLPIARYEVVYPGGDSTAVWSGAWTPFGELESETGDASMRPPWGFTGQLTLAGSESRELRLNQWLRTLYEQRMEELHSLPQRAPAETVGAALGAPE